MLSHSLACEPVNRHQHLIGVLPGEGVGPEIVPAALNLLTVLQGLDGHRFEIRHGGAIGHEAEHLHGHSLSADVIAFAQHVFAQGGCLFCGPGGGRFVYELRRHFDLFCKFTPLRPMPSLRDIGSLRPEKLQKVDIVAVRENTGGVYQGQGRLWQDDQGGWQASHAFFYTQQQVDRILQVAIRLALKRSCRLTVVLKPGGVPEISTLWQRRLTSLTKGLDLQVQLLEIDNALYQLIASPEQFDVIVSPNMFGDVIADTGGLLLGSRGLCYSGNFDTQGHAVYQTGHGAALDLAGKNLANPFGQMLSLAMLLEESCNWKVGAELIRSALQAVAARGGRTRDMAGTGATVLGTLAMADVVLHELEQQIAQGGF